MKIWTRIGSVLSGMSLLGLSLLAATGQGRKKKRTPGDAPETARSTNSGTPNILLFVIDDLDAETLQVMLDAGQLPNIKSKIVDGAACFQNTYVPASVCAPSRASLMTGKFSHNHGVWQVLGKEGPAQFDNYLVASGQAYLPTWLGASYYRAFIGKFHLGFRHPQWDYYCPVTGYDPRPGRYVAVEDGVRVTPKVFQTKYVGDQAKRAIAASGVKPLFMIVAPLAIHSQLISWRRMEDYSDDPYTGQPVAFCQFRNTPSVSWRQHLVTVDFSSGGPIYLWWARDSQSRDSGWGQWSFQGDAGAVAPGTGSEAVVGWNVLQPANNTRRQQLVRQAGTKVEFYTRDIVDGRANPWALTADESVLDGTGTDPVAGWAALAFPSGLIRQQVVRGSETRGYVSYMRHRRPGEPHFTPWRLDPEWGEQVVFGKLGGFNLLPTEGANYIVQIMVRRPGAAGFDWWQSPEFVDFYELTADGAGAVTAMARAKDIPVFEEGDMYSDPNLAFSRRGYVERDGMTPGTGPQSAPEGPPQVVSPVHPCFLTRAYGEGNWAPILPGQTYDYGSDLPAGRLRPNHDPNGFTPIAPQYTLPTGKPSFNRQADVNVPFYFPATWPDLTGRSQDGRHQQDYLQRLYLDRLEQLLSVDRMVGEVLNAAGPNTVILFTGDNGYLQGEHRLSNKQTPHEESIRVPLYIRTPAGASRTVASLAANIDIAPTILDFAGRSWSDSVFNIDGRSLRPLVESGSAPDWRRSLLLEYHQARDPNVPARSRTDWRVGLPDYLGLRQHASGDGGGSPINTLYVQYYDDIMDLATDFEYEYYLVDTDPFQINNVAEGRVVALDSALRAFYASAGEACRQQDRQTIPPPA